MTEQSGPKFVTFEGTEGVGKTTAIRLFCQSLAERGIDFIQTREPGGSPLAEEWREILLDKNQDISRDTEILLMFSARADHLHHKILPALASGKWVVCDRFFDSTIAYQGFGRYAGDKRALDKIELLIEHFVQKEPDVTFWLDLDVKIGMQRAGKRGELDRFESEDVAFFERVYQGFERQYHKSPDRIKRIDATGTPEEVIAKVWQMFGNI